MAKKLKFNKIGDRGAVVCIGSFRCNQISCPHHNKHPVGYAYDEDKHDSTFKTYCKQIYYCRQVNGFVRCITYEDFKKLTTNDPNYLFSLEKTCPSFDHPD